MAKQSLWYQRGYASANFDDYLLGSESCELMARLIGNKHEINIFRFPKKLEEFKKGYCAKISNGFAELRRQRELSTPSDGDTA